MSARDFSCNAAITEAPLRVGTWVMLVRNPAILSMLRQAGFDYARFDMEHTPIALDTIGSLVHAAKACGIDLCVRPPAGRPEWIAALIRAGVRHLFVPQIETPEAAAVVAEAARQAVTASGGGELPHIAVMLESVEAFRRLEGIAEVPGIDMLAMGPADLAQELGIYGQPDETAVIDRYRLQVRDVAIARGKEWEMGAWSEADLFRWIAAGCRMVTYQTETTVLRQTYSAAAKVVAEFNRRST